MHPPAFSFIIEKAKRPKEETMRYLFLLNRIFGGVDGIIRRAPPGPGGSGSDLRDELDSAVLLARSGVQ